MSTKKSSDEAFYLDENGEKQDREIHEFILDNPEAEELCRQQSIAALRAQGFTEEQLVCMFSKVRPPE